MSSIPLFNTFKNLANTIPHISLGSFPTDIHELSNLENETGISGMFIKRDDRSGNDYGGNKVRKLEFLLARAKDMEADRVLTIGFAGSNHALATAYYAQKTGLKSISLLLPQPNAGYVRKNLLLSHACGGELHHCKSMFHLALKLAMIVGNQWINKDEKTYVIPVGGSSITGVLGFVNAALELKEQVERGDMPEPDYIYVAMGTMGTAAGLITGLKYAELKTKVVAVRVVESMYADEQALLNLVKRTHSYLRSIENEIPDVQFTKDDFIVNNTFFGDKYALFTKDGMDAVKLLKSTENIKLEGTYTGKTLAALIDDGKKGLLKDKTILFWDTYNSWDFKDITDNISYKSLPGGFHHYFTEEVQPLEMDYRD